MNNFIFKFIKFNKKENANKMIFLGIVLLVLGTLSLILNKIGIKLTSWSIAFILAFIAYINLKNINELRRYQSKEALRPYTRIQIILIIATILLILFPVIMPKIISCALGAYLLAKQILILIRDRNNPYYKFGAFNIFFIVLGLLLVLFPLFLANLISNVLAFMMVLISFYLISTGKKLKRSI